MVFKRPLLPLRHMKLAAFMLVLCTLSACATVERVPLVSTSDAGISQNSLTIYFFDEDPEKSRIVREVVWSD